MKRIYCLLFLVTIVFISACNEAPEFPNTPKIEYEGILFRDIGGGDADSLIVTLSFEDGDGDLGLGTQEFDPPYNPRNYYSKSLNSLVAFTGNVISDQDRDRFLTDILKFSDRNSSEFDTLPDYIGEARCLFWETNPDFFFQDGTQLQDTLYFQFNERHHNIFIDFYINRGSGFEFFNWRVENSCLPLDGRFPVLNPDDGERALEGTIRYSMPSFGFRSIFGEDQVRLEITIVDRAGNFSNTIETPPFRLSEID